MGRFSAHMTWILILVMLTYGFNSFLERRENPNAELMTFTGHSERVVLQSDRRGQYRAPGTINGTPVTFIVDTGATYVSLSKGLANRLSLPIEGQGFATTANGQVQVELTVLNNVQLGGLRMSSVQAMIMPVLDEEVVLLGMSFLKHLELIQRGGELSLSLPSRK